MNASPIGPKSSRQTAEPLARLCLEAFCGDREAESLLLAKVYPRVRRYLQRTCWNKTAVDDHVQATMEVLLQKIRSKSIRRPEKVLEYALGIARKTLLGHSRKVDRLCLDGIDEAALQDAAGSDPLARLISLETRSMVRDSLGKLPVARDRIVLGATYLAEKSSGKVASELGISTNHVYRVLFRARHRLRRQIETPAFDLAGRVR